MRKRKCSTRAVSGVILAATLLSLPATARAADYSFETEADTEYYGSTSYEEVYGSAYNYGGANVVDYITTDARGVAASRPLPLGRYKIVEVTAPAYWQVDSTVHDVTLEYSGQIIKLSA